MSLLTRTLLRSSRSLARSVHTSPAARSNLQATRNASVATIGIALAAATGLVAWEMGVAGIRAPVANEEGEYPGL